MTVLYAATIENLWTSSYTVQLYSAGTCYSVEGETATVWFQNVTSLKEGSQQCWCFSQKGMWRMQTLSEWTMRTGSVYVDTRSYQSGNGLLSIENVRKAVISILYLYGKETRLWQKYANNSTRYVKGLMLSSYHLILPGTRLEDVDK